MVFLIALLSPQIFTSMHSKAAFMILCQYFNEVTQISPYFTATLRTNIPYAAPCSKNTAEVNLFSVP